MRAFVRIVILLVLLALFAAGCAKREQSATSVASMKMASRAGGAKADERAMPGAAAKMAAPDKAPAPVASMAGEAARMAAAGADQTGSQQAKETAAMVESAKIIYTGHVALEVPSIEESEGNIRQAVEKCGGYVSKSDINYSEGSGAGGTLTVRVPCDRYSQLYNDLRSGTYGYVLTGREETQDVTEDWVDVESRIRVLTAQRNKYEEMLKQRTSLQDITELERQIMDLQMQIEQSQGKMNVLRNRVFLSTIDIELRLRRDESELLRAERETGKWKPGRVFERSFAGLRSAWQTIVNIAIVVGTYIPCWVPVALILWLVYRGYRRFEATRKSDDERRLKAWEAYRKSQEHKEGGAEESGEE